MNLCMYLCKTEPLQYSGSVCSYFIFAVIASIISSLLYVGFSAGEISASPIVPPHSTDSASGKETSHVSFADCTAAKSKLPSGVLPPSEITALILKINRSRIDCAERSSLFTVCTDIKIRAEDFFKSCAVICADIPVNIAHVNKSAAELFTEFCGFFKLVVCHTFTHRDGNLRGEEVSCFL